MFHAPAFYTMLGVSEDVVEPTAYELLGLDPQELGALDLDGVVTAIERSLAERKKRLRLSTPGLGSVPVVVGLEGKLGAAARLLLDPQQRQAYDTHLASKVRQRALKPAMARHQKLGPRVREAIDAALVADGTLADEARARLARRLQAIGVSEKNAASILTEIPRPVVPPEQPEQRTVRFFVGAVDSVLGGGSLAASDEFELNVLAGKLGIPGQWVAQIVQERLSATGVQRTTPATSSGQARFAEQLHKLYPERDAGPKQRADLLALGIAQGLRADEAQQVIQAHFELPVAAVPVAEAVEVPEAVLVAPVAAGADEEVVEAILVDDGKAGPVPEAEQPRESGVSALKVALAARAARSAGRHVKAETAPRPARPAWNLWLAVSILAAAAALLTVVLILVVYIGGDSGERRPGPAPTVPAPQAPPPSQPKRGGSRSRPARPAPVPTTTAPARPPRRDVALSLRLATVARSRPQLVAAVRAADPADLAVALRELAHLAAQPERGSSAGAMAALAQIAQDAPGPGVPEEAKRGARSALCAVIRTTDRAATAEEARAIVFQAIRGKAPLPATLVGSLEDSLDTPAARQAAANELERAVLRASAVDQDPW